MSANPKSITFYTQQHGLLASSYRHQGRHVRCHGEYLCRVNHSTLVINVTAHCGRVPGLGCGRSNVPVGNTAGGEPTKVRVAGVAGCDEAHACFTRIISVARVGRARLAAEPHRLLSSSRTWPDHADALQQKWRSGASTIRSTADGPIIQCICDTTASTSIKRVQQLFCGRFYGKETLHWLVQSAQQLAVHLRCMTINHIGRVQGEVGQLEAKGCCSSSGAAQG